MPFFVGLAGIEDKDDTLHPDISGRDDEPHNTCSISGMQEKKFPVPNNIANAEEVSIVEYEFSKLEFSDTVTSTVMCSNKELEELMGNSVAGENNKSEPKAPLSPLRATEFDNIVLEVNEELKPEVSPLSWNSDISERVAVDGSFLQKEMSCAKSANVSERNQSKNVKVESENRNEVGAFNSLTREMSDMPEFISSLPSHVTELGHLVGEVKELKPKDLSSLWSTENVPRRTAEDGNSLYKQGEEHIAVGIEGREVETIYEDTIENDSRRTLSMYGDAHQILDKLPMERKWISEETVCLISGEGNNPCFLYLDPGGRYVGRGILHNDLNDRILHGVTLEKEYVRVQFEVAVKSEFNTKLPIPCDEANVVGDAPGYFLAWPRKLFFQTPPITINKERAINNRIGKQNMSPKKKPEDKQKEKTVESNIVVSSRPLGYPLPDDVCHDVVMEIVRVAIVLERVTDVEVHMGPYWNAGPWIEHINKENVLEVLDA
ncbi:hypothetical protein POM88_000808 [Heracleum sosnowskyi]|uniref:DUF8039 domain-containing protein n=1 Tax=Heracleum sosnowskyi TaxID=360622 RepID=A0AAD8JDP9_9APIA|nr:hypothetical protein POM88_000808 [Heracleum sosnowskyi]